MANNNLNTTVTATNNNNVKGGHIMKTCTLTKAGIGERVFATDGTKYIVQGIETTKEAFYSVYKTSTEDGWVHKNDPKKSAPAVEAAKNYGKRYMWNKAGKTAWAVQYNIYLHCLKIGGYARDKKGEEYHNAVTSKAKELMKDHEQRTYTMINTMIVNGTI